MSKNLKNSSQKSRAPKNTARAFLKRVQNTLHKTRLLPPGSRILIAVSGGPDSMALLSILSQLQKKYAWQLAIAHVNYGLRGKESDQDMALVQKTAETLGIPLYNLKKRSLPKKSEEALRDIRYDFFKTLAEKHDFDLVALAHHQDDQAETVLMHLIRGSGSRGLEGMRPQRDIYIRPLLTFSKQEILNFVKEAKIPYRLDQSNTENIYFRNRVRNELLPLLETYNPKIKRTLATTAQTLQQENDEKKAL